eukprot:TRINITY_DN90747_c0_g1_i1.p1 TRINITY_DN90747_c0_g1~~TRINITY_DN90747_c0_g1_i1.p1  ORF type:complete len:576 (-),score=121.74 TRINITY_DN90747_c0_g1_i1:16-1701(-)
MLCSPGLKTAGSTISSQPLKCRSLNLPGALPGSTAELSRAALGAFATCLVLGRRPQLLGRRATQAVIDDLTVGCVVKVAGSQGDERLDAEFGLVASGPREDGCRVVSLPRQGNRRLVKEEHLSLAAEDERTWLAESVLDAGCAFQAQALVWGLPRLQALDLEQRLAKLREEGLHSEILDRKIAVADIPGKGKGYVAEKTIHKGDIILYDTAILKVPVKFDGDASQMVSESVDAEALMSHVDNYNFPEALRQLSGKTGAAQDFLMQEVLNLDVGPASEKISSEQETLIAAYHNNSFQEGERSLSCQTSWPSTYLFVAVARFNHSCCPNAYFDRFGRHGVIRAIKDITVGEEVCLSYRDGASEDSVDDRAFEKWGFQCDCERCQRRRMAPAPDFEATFKCWDHIQQAHKLSDPSLLVPDPGRVSKMTAMLSKIVSAALEVADASDGFEAGRPVPPDCRELLDIMRQLADCYKLLAMFDNCKGPAAEKSLSIAAGLYRRVLQAWSERHGEGNPLRERQYTSCLESLLELPFRPEDSRPWREELLEQRSLRYGQRDLPTDGQLLF